MDNANNYIDGENDIQDLASLVIRKIPSLPEKYKAFLSVESDADKIRIFDKKTDEGVERIGEIADKVESEFEIPDIREAGEPDFLEYGIEALEYPGADFDGELTISLIIKDKLGIEHAKDEVKIQIAPFLMLPNTANSEKIYVTRVLEIDEDRNIIVVNHALISAMKNILDHNRIVEIPGENYLQDEWVQDQFEIGYSKAPSSSMSVVWNLPRRDSLYFYGYRDDDSLVGPDFGHFDYIEGPPITPYFGGNVEVTPPFGQFPFGRIVIGNNMNDERMKDFLRAQKLQWPFIEIDVNWLDVGHVDEVINFIPGNSSNTFKVLVADPALAIDLIETLSDDEPVFYEGKSDSGTATGGTPTTMSVDKDFDEEDWLEAYIRVYDGPGDKFGKGTYKITGVTNNTFEINKIYPTIGGVANHDDHPINGSKYILVESTKMWSSPGNDPDYPAVIAASEIKSGLSVPHGGMNLISKNLVISDLINNTIEENLPQELDADIIRIPVFYTATWAGVGLDNVQNAEAYIPNMVNLQVFNNHLFIPKPYIGRKNSNGDDIFEEEVRKVLEGPLGLNIHFIDDWMPYHDGGGEIHCGTNVKREPPSNLFWWDHWE
jgi:hypothetical protein